MDKRFLSLTRLEKIRAYISCHPLVMYVALAYAISWAAWFIFWLDKSGATNGLNVLAGAGPSLAAMAISAIQKPEAARIPARKRWFWFCLMLLVVWAILFLRRDWLTMGLVAIPGRPLTQDIYPSPVALLIDLLGASAVAFVASGVFSPLLATTF